MPRDGRQERREGRGDGEESSLLQRPDGPDDSWQRQASQVVVPLSVTASATTDLTCPHWLAQNPGLDGIPVAITNNSKLIFTGGYVDCSLKCHELTHGKPSTTATAKIEKSLPPGMSPPRVELHVSALSSVPTNSQICALVLSYRQNMLLTGGVDGCVMLWRVYTAKHERVRAPLSSGPMAAFSVHSGRVLDLAISSHVDVAVSLAVDRKGESCSAALYSTRRARFIRSFDLQMLAPKGERLAMERVSITPGGCIVFYGLLADVPMLFLLSLNGVFLCSVQLEERLSVLECTAFQPSATTLHHGFIMTGGDDSVVHFRDPQDLTLVQSFSCLPQPPYSTAHWPSRTGSATAEQAVEEGGEGRGEDVKEEGGRVLSMALSQGQRHLVVAIEAGHGLPPRMLLFPIPHGGGSTHSFGYYIDVASQTLDSVKDVVTRTVLSRVEETKEVALETLEMAKGKIEDTKGFATAQVGKARSKLVGVFGMLFKKGEEK